MKSPTELAQAFRARGLKVTPQRQLLFTLLEHDTTHPTAESLYVRASAQMPGISLRTVYTTLTDLVAMGELRTVTLGAGATRFDTNGDDHHHGVCDRCGRLVDLDVRGCSDLVAAVSETSEQFVPRSASIVFQGNCPSCVPDAQRSIRPSSPQSNINPNISKEHCHG